MTRMGRPSEQGTESASLNPIPSEKVQKRILRPKPDTGMYASISVLSDTKAQRPIPNACLLRHSEELSNARESS